MDNEKNEKLKRNKKPADGSQIISKEDALHKIPLRITDTTLRDAHQSLWATRMRTEDIIKIIDVVDRIGYYSIEMWGGATFDVCLRFLRENPWERLRLIKSHAKNTPLQMLLRGQNLVGYRNYADDVVDRFVALACANGVDIFRVFDALNDTRNLESAIKAVKKHGGHAQGTLAYTISPVHTVEKYVHYAKEQVALGIDSLCIKDMAGILSPIAAEKLVSALLEEVGVPIQLHCHATSGMATATYVEGVRAGAGAIDCAISSMAGFSSQPPVETLVAIFNETNYAANLDMDALAEAAKYFEALTLKRRLKNTHVPIIDPGILLHQIPGGMISNFRSQLDMQGALDKLPQTLAEVARVREDLGYPPLVTPTSQIVGTLAVMNILSGGRYKIVPNEVKEYAKGMYGQPPASINPKVLKIILGDEKPIKHRPADTISPMLPHATDGIEPNLIESEEDIISYCILPEPAMEYFQWRKLPPDQRPPIPADSEQQKSMKTDARQDDKTANTNTRPAPQYDTPDQMLHLEDYRGFGHLLRQAAGMHIEEFHISKGDFSLLVRSGQKGKHNAAAACDSAHSLDVMGKMDSVEVDDLKSPLADQKNPLPNDGMSGGKTEENVSADNGNTHTVNAPLVGTFYSCPRPGKPPFASIGDRVKKGDKVCVVEAMKLFNEIEVLEDCIIKALLVKDGDSVQKGQPLIAYEPV